MRKVILSLLIILCLIAVSYGEDTVGTNTIKLESQIDNVVWCGNNRVQNEEDETIVLDDIESRITNIMFMTTNNGEVYLTNNHGEKWSNMTAGIHKNFGDKINKEKRLNIKSMLQSPADPQTIFLFGNNGQSFIAEKCGKSLKMIEHEKNLENFKLNRMKKELIMAFLPTQCNKFDDECESGENQLYVTEDMGQNWRKILDNVYEANWDKLIHYVLVPDHRIIAHQRIYYSGKGNDPKLLTYSDDFYKSKQQIDKEVLHYYQSNQYLFLLTSSEVEDSYSLKTAPAFSQDYKPQQIELPFKRLKDHSFTVLDSVQGQMYLGINHQDHNSKLTNVYQSDFQGRKFNLALMNAVRNIDGNVDFERIQSNEGTFIANIYDATELERLQNSPEKPGKLAKKSSQTFLNYENIKKTVVSFNRGSTWHHLKAPEYDYNGEETNCSGECSLHLKGRTDLKGNPIYSSDTAPGLIIGTGNIGIFLEEKEENLNTYLSNDGGHNWLEVAPKPHIYEIGDRGGIIVMARSDVATDHIHYSWDHGVTWSKYTISKKPMDIVNIVTEQSNMTQRFLVFGKRKGDKSNKMQGYVTALDFSKLHQRVCSGHWDPLDPESDFEYWSPLNYNEEKCLFGSRLRYIRRKPSTPCFNPEEFDTIADVQSCECTEEDYECSFGFYRDDDNKCIPMTSAFGKEKSSLEQAPPNPCKGFYIVPTGYEKVHGNYCQGGLDLSPIRKECPKQEADEPKEYVPLDQEVHVDLDDQHAQIAASRNQQIKEHKENIAGSQQQQSESSGVWLWVGLGAGIILLVVLFKESLISLIMFLIPSKDIGGSGRLNSNYENLGLVGRDDYEDDEEEQL